MQYSPDHAKSIPVQLLCDVLATGKPLEKQREETLRKIVLRMDRDDPTKITEKAKKFARSARNWAEQNPDDAARTLIQRNLGAALRFVTLTKRRMGAEAEREFMKACYEQQSQKRWWVRYCARFGFIADNHSQILLDSFGDRDRNSRGATREYILKLQEKKKETMEFLMEVARAENLRPESTVGELMELLRR